MERTKGVVHYLMDAAAHGFREDFCISGAGVDAIGEENINQIAGRINPNAGASKTCMAEGFGGSLLGK